MSQVQSGRFKCVKVDGSLGWRSRESERSIQKWALLTQDSWAKLDGHLSQSRRAKSIVNGLLSQSGGLSTKSGRPESIDE